MTVVIVALVGLALFVALAAAVAWQERSRALDRSIVYGVEDSIEFVAGRLGDAAGAVLGRSDVRRILEWSVRYLQDADRGRAGGPPVAGGIEAARYVQDRCLEAGFAYDGELILEVLGAQNEYLAALGAVGEEVDRPPHLDGDDDGTG